MHVTPNGTHAIPDSIPPSLIPALIPRHSYLAAALWMITTTLSDAGGTVRNGDAGGGYTERRNRIHASASRRRAHYEEQ